MKKAIRALLPASVPWLAIRLAERLDPHVHLSYSQDGEDMVLRRLNGDKTSGFYVDVGAHHPTRFSNTCYFHRRGWRGINIDADPDAVEAFKRARPGDVNICQGVGSASGELAFHRFTEPALNTFDPALAQSRLEIRGIKLIERVIVKVRPLADILDEHLPPDQVIDVLNVDVEGLDETVLDSNDWRRFRPTYILIEVLRVPFEQLNSCSVVRKMRERGYEIVAKTANTIIMQVHS